MNEQAPRMPFSRFHSVFLETDHLTPIGETPRQLPQGSAAKRINMFLRWMVRKRCRGVDFGLWKSISPAALICPLDLHTGKTARALGLLQRKANDWKAAVELTGHLRHLDPEDPVKYDFALFGLSISREI